MRILVKERLHFGFHPLFKPTRGLQRLPATGSDAAHAQRTHQGHLALAEQVQNGGARVRLACDYRALLVERSGFGLKGGLAFGELASDD